MMMFLGDFVVGSEVNRLVVHEIVISRYAVRQGENAFSRQLAEQ
jgi:hypothetical protein